MTKVSDEDFTLVANHLADVNGAAEALINIRIELNALRAVASAAKHAMVCSGPEVQAADAACRDALAKAGL
jgi:hypothetical protein